MSYDGAAELRPARRLRRAARPRAARRATSRPRSTSWPSAAGLPRAAAGAAAPHDGAARPERARDRRASAPRPDARRAGAASSAAAAWRSPLRTVAPRLRRVGLALLTLVVALRRRRADPLFFAGRDSAPVPQSSRAAGAIPTGAARAPTSGRRSAPRGDPQRPRRHAPRATTSCCTRSSWATSCSSTATRAPPARCARSQRTSRGPFDPALAAAGQAVILARRPGDRGRHRARVAPPAAGAERRRTRRSARSPTSGSAAAPAASCTRRPPSQPRAMISAMACASPAPRARPDRTPSSATSTATSAKIRDAIERARAQGAQLVLFPELARDRLPAGGPAAQGALPRDARAALEPLAAATTGHRRARRLPRARRRRLQRRSPCSPTARVQAVYRKVYLPNYGVFDEQRYFQSGDRAAR